MPYDSKEKRRQQQARWYREKYWRDKAFQEQEAQRKAEWLQTKGKPMNAASSKYARYLKRLRKSAAASLVVLAFASCATPEPLTFSTPERDAQRIADRKAFFEKHKAPEVKYTPLPTSYNVTAATPATDLEYRVRELERLEHARFNDSIVFRQSGESPLYR